MLAVWIKRHLEEVGEDYPYSMYLALKSRYGNKVSYDTLRVYIYRLKKAGFVELSRTERAERQSIFERHYYRITDRGRRAGDEEWVEAVRG